MSKIELEFKKFLIENNIEFEEQPIVYNVSFSKNGKYKYDFKIYNKDKSEYIYIEIKGLMTLETIGKLQYLSKVHPENMYILQLTETDWNKVFHNNTLKYKKNIQYSEILDFVDLKICGDILNNISIDRLEMYISYKTSEALTYSRYSAYPYDLEDIYNKIKQSNIADIIYNISEKKDRKFINFSKELKDKKIFFETNHAYLFSEDLYKLLTLMIEDCCCMNLEDYKYSGIYNDKYLIEIKYNVARIYFNNQYIGFIKISDCEYI